MTLSLDHIGLVAGAGVSLREQFVQLGFQLTDEEELLRSDASGAREPLGQRSCHAVLAQGYIELSEVYSPDPGHHLAAYLRRGPGLHILALGAADIAAAHRQCESAGLPCTAISWASRDIHYGERHGAARFEWFMVLPEAAPDGLLCFVRNHTPELVYQPQVMTHPNGALALRGLVVACRDPELAARRYERILGVNAARDGGDLVLRLAGGEIVLRDLQRCAASYGTPANATQDYYAAARLGVADLARAGAWLEARALPYVMHEGRLQLRADLACGAGLELEPH